MQIINSSTCFKFTRELDIHGVPMRGIREKQGIAFSRHGWLRASMTPNVNADEAGQLIRRARRPMSASTLAGARSDYDLKHTPDFPSYFIIEPVSTCNKHCFFCPIGVIKRIDETRNEERPGMMRWQDFTKLMDECAQHSVYGLSLYQLGEPMLWRGKNQSGKVLSIADMVLYASGSGFEVVNISTNGDVANMDELLDCDLSDLYISIDGVTAEVYYRNRPSVKSEDPVKAFDRTLERVEGFLSLKAKHAKREPWVRMQIINNALCAPQVLQFIKYWIRRPGVDDVFVKNLDGMNPWLGDAVVDPAESQRKMEKVKSMPCQHLWTIGSMTSSGTLNACCHDARSELTDGANIRTMTFHQWWHGPFMQYIRRTHTAGAFVRPCVDCAERDPWLG